MVFSNSFTKMPLERKEELRDMAIYVHGYLLESMNARFYKRGYHPCASQKVNDAYSIFKRVYNSELSSDEMNVFSLYVLFPDDNYLDNMIEKYGKNFEKIATFFNVNSSVVKLRYLLQKNIAAEKKYQEELNAVEEETQIKTK